MTASQPTVLERAKQGDAQAIAALMNRYLKPKGITATAALENSCLQVWLESERVPKQATLVEFTRRGITNLRSSEIKTVKVCGVQTGDPDPAWKEEINLESPLDVSDSPPLSGFPSELSDLEVASLPTLSETDSLSRIDSVPQDSVPQDSVPQNDIEVSNSKVSSYPNSPPDKKQDSAAMLGRNWKTIATMAAIVVVGSAVGFLSVVFIGTRLQQAQNGSSSETAIAPSQPTAEPASPTSQPTASAPAQTAPAPSASPSAPAQVPVTGASPAPYNQALEVGLSAAVRTQTAQTRADWQAVAAEWQAAIALLNQVPESDANYATAQQKVSEYQNNLAYAQQKANAAP